MLSQCSQSRPEIIQFPPEIEISFKPEVHSPPDKCEYRLNYRSRRTEEKGRFKRGFCTSTNQKKFGFSFINHSLFRYEIDATKIFDHCQILEKIVRSSSITQPSELLFSDNAYTIDEISVFLPKPVKEVTLKISSRKKDLSFNGDSQFLCNE